MQRRARTTTEEENNVMLAEEEKEEKKLDPEEEKSIRDLEEKLVGKGNYSSDTPSCQTFRRG